MTATRRAPAGAALALAALGCLTACDDDRPPPDDPTPPPAAPPDAEAFLPHLDGYRTDDDVDAGEIRSSLDHGVPYEDVRRRLILDDDGFAAGDIMVVTFEPGADGPDRFLDHWFGGAPREPVTIAGEAMLRVATQPHDAIAWTGPGFAVVFGWGAGVDHAWLEGLARATVETARPDQPPRAGVVMYLRRGCHE